LVHAGIVAIPFHTKFNILLKKNHHKVSVNAIVAEVTSRVCSWKVAGGQWFSYRPRGAPNVVHTMGSLPCSHK
jgi:hypothetical protein